jgi:hypothetical protein
MPNIESIMRDLNEGYVSLGKALVALKETNKKQQLDYCTSSKLSRMLDDVLSVTKALDKIVYQK